MSLDRATFNAILRDVRHGIGIGKSCAENKVSVRSFYDVLDRSDRASERYARAKSDGLDRHAERLVQLAHECRPGIKTKRTPQPDLVVKDKKGRLRRRKRPDLVEVVEGDMVERTRLEIDTIKWLLAKLAPKKYGDRLELGGELTQKVVRVKDLTGSKGGNDG